MINEWRLKIKEGGTLRTSSSTTNEHSSFTWLEGEALGGMAEALASKTSRGTAPSNHIICNCSEFKNSENFGTQIGFT